MKRLLALVGVVGLLCGTAGARSPRKDRKTQEKELAEALGALSQRSLNVPAEWQRCTVDDDCVFAATVCGGDVAIHRAFKERLAELDRATCGNGAVLTMKREAGCARGRCTLRSSPPELKLFMEDGEPFDGACNALKQHDDYKITQPMRDELVRRIPEFERTWKEHGTPLVNALPALLGPSYGRTEETLTLTLCQWFSPMSNPLMLRMREYLKTTATELKPEGYFVAQVFHELIHRYLDRHFPNIDSALLKAHATEPPGVLSHLHHLSIQKAVYLKLNRNAELELLIAEDSRIRGGVYRRAWEIVNSDGYQKYPDELKRK